MKITLALFAVLAASSAWAQSPAFDVASVKPVSQEQFVKTVQSGQRPHVGVTIDKNRVDMGYQSLSDILARAYDVVPIQITGPDFIKTERYDILAKLPAGATEDQVPQMLQALLAERFKLVVHREKKESNIYALVVGKGGLKKMKPATAEEMAPEPMPGDQTQNTQFGKMTMRQTSDKGMVAFMPGLGTLKVTGGGNGEHIEFSNLTTTRFAQMLMSGADRVVVDKTGLKGSYEASFDISMDAPPPPPPPGGEGGAPSLAAAPMRNPMFQAAEQMGLRLDPQKEIVDMIVIDHVEKTPTEN